MGKYVNSVKGVRLPSKDKVIALLEQGASIVTGVPKFQPNLICVADNGPFECAAYCYSEEEFNRFYYPDGRSKVWLTLEGVDKMAM